MEVDNESSHSSSPAQENQEVQEVNPPSNEAESTGVEPMEQEEVNFIFE